MEPFKACHFSDTMGIAAAVAVVALVLCACSAELQTAQTGEPLDAACVTAAHDRALDARHNGYDCRIADKVYQESYKTCTLWNTKRTIVAR
jgi:hypothetical protein